MLKTVKYHQYLRYALLTLITLCFPIWTQAQLADFGFGQKVPVEKLSAKGYLSLDKVQPGSQFEIGSFLVVVSRLPRDGISTLTPRKPDSSQPS